ncbi:hypothetical protein B0J13DRAFT_558948 [Dactylonectria estremocensis]|uniref:Heat shock protein 70 n=1 Tax=Dactylonectria estremocensis TaxID=1079267 RepID=A0A9P9J0K7_9HYPO|nr:hypothetical protein B0J13DRAFT_558948 [Dactylonectria estremocensis]
MSVVGVDFGTLKTVIAVARNRGVDVVTNEVSNRSTPYVLPSCAVLDRATLPVALLSRH